ncbi:MAG: hypothetical protein KDI56_14155, partial [Xanthomonadales bacterium]|nr:hypothetical protein [Xanthomonadales bacterium]
RRPSNSRARALISNMQPPPAAMQQASSIAQRIRPNRQQLLCIGVVAGSVNGLLLQRCGVEFVQLM